MSFLLAKHTYLRHPTLKRCVYPTIYMANTNLYRGYGDKRDAGEKDKVKVSKVQGQERIVRGPPGKVIWGFVPVEWVNFFYSKTGVTGFYTFVTTFGCYLVSKEKYVMEHEYYSGLGTVLLWFLAAKYIGPGFAKMLDKDVDKYEKDWNEGRENEKAMLNADIEDEHQNQKSLEANIIIVKARREAIAVQQETEYRLRFMKVYEDVIKRLNYQTKIGYTHKYFIRKNMLDWVRSQVLSVTTPDWNAKYIDFCINKLSLMRKPGMA